MTSIKEIMSVISNQIVVPVIVTAVTTIITSKIKDKIKRRQKAKDKLKEVLIKIEDKEEKTNSPITYNDYCYTYNYNSYLGDLEELEKLINIYEKDIPKESISSFKELYQEIKRKLIIYEQAFIINDDIQKRERKIYYSRYIDPNQTKIQQKLEELLKL